VPARLAQGKPAFVAATVIYRRDRRPGLQPPAQPRQLRRALPRSVGRPGH
jgi:hypothetical protein